MNLLRYVRNSSDKLTLEVRENGVWKNYTQSVAFTPRLNLMPNESPEFSTIQKALRLGYKWVLTDWAINDLKQKIEKRIKVESEAFNNANNVLEIEYVEPDILRPNGSLAIVFGVMKVAGNFIPVFTLETTIKELAKETSKPFGDLFIDVIAYYIPTEFD